MALERSLTSASIQCANGGNSGQQKGKRNELFIKASATVQLIVIR
jgi:hypothetical protein